MTPEQRKVAVAVALGIATVLVAPLEGIKRTFYYDPPGIATVCYGHTGPDVDKAKVYSIEECKVLLNKDMLYALNIVERCAPGLPPRTLAAWGSAVYNLGPKIVCDTSRSTAARMLAAGDYQGACNQLPRWDRATVLGASVALPGLTKRRALERDLCLSGLTPKLGVIG